MRTQPLSITTDPQIRACFEAQLAKARETLNLSSTLADPAPDIYSRFARYHGYLHHLPRRARRSMQRQWKRSLSALALLLALGQAPVLAATIHVNGTNCTLADAIRSANTDSAVGGCAAGSGADRLVLKPKSTHTLTTIEDTSYGGAGLPLILSTVTITGKRSTIERGAGTPESRLLSVGSFYDATTGTLEVGNLYLNDLTLRGGSIGSSGYSYDGGAIFNFGGGTLSLRHCTVSGNAGGDGGGVATSFSTLTLVNSKISGNTATQGAAGGVLNDGGTLVLRDSTISGNTAQLGAGGVHTSGPSEIKQTTVSGNTALGGDGGGIYAMSGEVTIKGSTISRNAALSGGGLSIRTSVILSNSTVSGNTADRQGGGVMNLFGSLAVTNSTISGNEAKMFGGGGLLVGTGSLVLTNSTVVGNTAAAEGGGVYIAGLGYATLTRSLISGNTALSGPEVSNYIGYFSGTVLADNFNLFGHSGNEGVVNFAPGPTDIVPTEPLSHIVGALGNNGGPTRTHALVPGGPAIDAVQAGCPPPHTDQRGVRRPVDGDRDRERLCDIGAFEFRPGGPGG